MTLQVVKCAHICDKSKRVSGHGVVVLTDREQASHARSARTGRSRQRQTKWAGPRVSALERRW